MRRQFNYRVILTVVLADGTTARTKAVPVRASSEERAVEALKGVMQRQTGQLITDTIFCQVSF